MNGCSETADEHIQWTQSGNEVTSLFLACFHLFHLLYCYFNITCYCVCIFSCFFEREDGEWEGFQSCGQDLQEEILVLDIFDYWGCLGAQLVAGA